MFDWFAADSLTATMAAARGLATTLVLVSDEKVELARVRTPGRTDAIKTKTPYYSPNKDPRQPTMLTRDFPIGA